MVTYLLWLRLLPLPDIFYDRSSVRVLWHKEIKAYILKINYSASALVPDVIMIGFSSQPYPAPVLVAEKEQ